MLRMRINRAAIFRYIKYVICATAGIIAGLVLFFPWGSAADLVFAKKAAQLAEKNIYVTCRSIEDENLIRKVLVITGLRADLPTAGAELSELRISPCILKALTGTPSAEIETGRGEVTLITKQKLQWNSASAVVSIKNNIIEISDIAVTGKLRASGFISITPSTQKIEKALLTITVPEELDRAFEMAQRAGILPVTKLGKGKWQVKR